MALPSLHLSKCHLVGILMPRLIFFVNAPIELDRCPGSAEISLNKTLT